MSVVQGLLLGISVLVFIYLGRRHVQARVVLRWASSGPSSSSSSCWRWPGGISAPTWSPCSRGGCTSSASSSGPIYRLLGTSPEKEQTWKRYAGSVVVFSGLSIGITYAILRLQGSLPLNPAALRRRRPGAVVEHGHLVRHQHQLAELRRRRDHVVPLADVRADRAAVRHARRRHRGRARSSSAASPRRARRPSATSGSTSPGPCSTCSPRSPSSAGLIFVGQGAVDTLGGPVNIHNALNGVSPDHRPRAGRLHGGHQAAGHQRRGVLQHQLGPSLREPDRA